MLSSGVLAQTLAKRGWQGSGWTVESWWESAVFYQIDPLTFQDTKGNGFGDLRGILQRLDYVQSLGVDALILSPFPFETTGTQPTSNAPFDAAYGSEEDLNALVQEASRRRMRVLVDLPLDSTFSGEETANAARFWLSRGLAGLRLTSSNPQGIPLTAAQTFDRVTALERLCSGYPGQRILFWDLPESLASSSSAPVQVSHPRRRSAHRRTSTPPVAGVAESPAVRGPQLIFDGSLLALNRWQAGDLAHLLTSRPHGRFPLVRPVIAADASGRPRSFDRFSDGAHPVDIAKQAAALLLLGQNIPEMYAGQEIGMQTASAGTPSSSAATSGEPSPMQWGGSPGFTSGVPWVPPGPNAATANVALEDGDEDSLLNWYRRLSSLRRDDPAVRGGSLDVLALAEPGVVAWVRRPRSGTSGGSPVVIVLNVSSGAAMVSLSAELRARNIPVGTGMLRTLASSAPAAHPAAPVPLNGIALAAYGVYVGELHAEPGLESVPAPARRRPSRHARASSTSGA